MEEVKRKQRKNSIEDRLSNLADDIIHHILSLLETKHAVQTSILSKSWRSHWKHVHVLDFEVQSFASNRRGQKTYDKFVRSVLRSRRPRAGKSVVITKLRYTNRNMKEHIISRIVKYAVHRRIEHLNLTFPLTRGAIPLEIPTYSALKTLELCGFDLRESIRLPSITTMRLQRCSIGDDVDLFAGCHSLKILRLIDIDFESDGGVFRITAPQLIVLTIATKTTTLFYRRTSCKLRIFAPRLVHFGYNWDKAVEFAPGSPKCKISRILQYGRKSLIEEALTLEPPWVRTLK